MGNGQAGQPASGGGKGGYRAVGGWMLHTWRGMGRAGAHLGRRFRRAGEVAHCGQHQRIKHFNVRRALRLQLVGVLVGQQAHVAVGGVCQIAVASRRLRAQLLPQRLQPGSCVSRVLLLWLGWLLGAILRRRVAAMQRRRRLGVRVAAHSLGHGQCAAQGHSQNRGKRHASRHGGGGVLKLWGCGCARSCAAAR